MDFLRHVRLPALMWALTGMLFVTLASGISHAQNYVTQIQDFQQHIELHRERVVVLGMTLAASHFPNVSKKDLKDFLRLHDSSKTMRNSLPRLFEFYGKPPANEEARARLMSTVSDINAIDHSIAEKFFNERHLSPEMVEALYTIEKVADLVDRSLDPVAAEEFGRKLSPASQFFKEQELRDLSLWLESRYLNIVPHLQMAPIKSCRRVWN
ncbi:hypothetical protein [Bdellovibrio sp. HCB337]|uniref:hypothetical protein n=1 Tax=Bdellovibrio sp. HCB337 TaxID=3394358 RepID=UPI0039A74F58